MKFLASAASLSAEFRPLSRQYRYFDWAVAWAGGNHDAFKVLQRHRIKIRRIVVGTHFHQTSPEFIEVFAKTPSVRFRLDQEGLNGVFHPKLYMFSNSETDWEAVIGSANFTRGAFVHNVEHAILISSDDEADGVSYTDLVSEVDHLWAQGRQFTNDEFSAYRLRWARNRRFLNRVAGHTINHNRVGSIYDSDFLSLSWNGYLNALRDHREKFFEKRLVILHETRRIWTAEPSFAKLGKEERKQICGTASEKVLPWRLFGSMLNERNFKATLREENAHFLAAPDLIPLTGEVAEEHYTAFIEELARAFGKNAEEFGKLAGATRILCLRRPDYFVSVNQKNRNGLFKKLGVLPRAVTIQSYWDTIVAPLIDTPWWQSERPATDRESQTVWDGRVAMVDALFYEGHA